MTDEPESITVEIQLDPVHRRVAHTLEENGIDTEEIARIAASPAVEKALYASLQEKKYHED